MKTGLMPVFIAQDTRDLFLPPTETMKSQKLGYLRRLLFKWQTQATLIGRVHCVVLNMAASSVSGAKWIPMVIRFSQVKLCCLCCCSSDWWRWDVRWGRPGWTKRGRLSVTACRQAVPWANLFPLHACGHCRWKLSFFLISSSFPQSDGFPSGQCTINITLKTIFCLFLLFLASFWE